MRSIDQTPDAPGLDADLLTRVYHHVSLTRAVDEGELEPALVESRAQILASALMGAWLTVRIDPRDASQLCETIARDVDSWRTTDQPNPQTTAPPRR